MSLPTPLVSRRFKPWLIAATVLSLAASGRLAAQTTILLPCSDDTYVLDAESTLPHGSLPHLRVAYEPGPAVPPARWRTLLKFDLSAIPPGATIQNAVLRLYQTSALSRLDVVDVYRVADSWSEAAATWRNQPAVGARVAQVSPSAEEGWKDIGVQPCIIDWMSGAAPNHGLSLRTLETTRAGRVFASRESGNRAPHLAVTFISDPEPMLYNLGIRGARTFGARASRYLEVAWHAQTDAHYPGPWGEPAAADLSFDVRVAVAAADGTPKSTVFGGTDLVDIATAVDDLELFPLCTDGGCGGSCGPRFVRFDGDVAEPEEGFCSTVGIFPAECFCQLVGTTVIGPVDFGPGDWLDIGLLPRHCLVDGCCERLPGGCPGGGLLAVEDADPSDDDLRVQVFEPEVVGNRAAKAIEVLRDDSGSPASIRITWEAVAGPYIPLPPPRALDFSANLEVFVDGERVLVVPQQVYFVCPEDQWLTSGEGGGAGDDDDCDDDEWVVLRNGDWLRPRGSCLLTPLWPDCGCGLELETVIEPCPDGGPDLCPHVGDVGACLPGLPAILASARELSFRVVALDAGCCCDGSGPPCPGTDICCEVIYCPPPEFEGALFVDEEHPDDDRVTLRFEPGPVTFVRGDANYDGVINIADPIGTLEHLFLGGPMQCADGADFNDSGDLNIADPIGALEHLFLGGSPAPPPYPDCGVDPTPEALDCAAGASAQCVVH